MKAPASTIGRFTAQCSRQRAMGRAGSHSGTAMV